MEQLKCYRFGGKSYYRLKDLMNLYEYNANYSDLKFAGYLKNWNLISDADVYILRAREKDLTTCEVIQKNYTYLNVSTLNVLVDFLNRKRHMYLNVPEVVFAEEQETKNEPDINTPTELIEAVFSDEGSFMPDEEKTLIEPPEPKEDIPATTVSVSQEYITLKAKYERLKIEHENLQKMSERALVFTNAVSTSDECINISTLASILKQNGCDYGQKKLFEYFRKEGYIADSADGYEKNIPTEKGIMSGYFMVREVVVNGSGSKVHLTFTPKITGKGQAHFVNLFCLETEGDADGSL